MIPHKGAIDLDTNEYRIESESEVNAYLANLRYALDCGAKLEFQINRKVDEKRDEKYTNKYTVAYLFPNEDPKEALKRELKKLTVQDYLRTVKDRRFPKKAEMREFGKVYNNSDEIYIKIRVELLGEKGFGSHNTFVMSFHFAEKTFAKEVFPYKRGD